MKNLKKSMHDSFYFSIYGPINDTGDSTILWPVKRRILYSSLVTNMQDHRWAPYVYTVRTIVKDNFKNNSVF